jgi:hypothetical protein
MSYKVDNIIESLPIIKQLDKNDYDVKILIIKFIYEVFIFLERFKVDLLKLSLSKLLKGHRNLLPSAIEENYLTIHC